MREYCKGSNGFHSYYYNNYNSNFFLFINNNIRYNTISNHFESSSVDYIYPVQLPCSTLERNQYRWNVTVRMYIGTIVLARRYIYYIYIHILCNRDYLFREKRYRNNNTVKISSKRLERKNNKHFTQCWSWPVIYYTYTVIVYYFMKT